MSYEEIAARLARACGDSVEEIFAPAEDQDLESLSELGVPESVMEFYREFAPNDTIEVGDIRLLAVPQLLEENQTYSPGAELHDLGYVVVAGYRDGSVYCLDLGADRNQELPPIVRFPHDVRVTSQDRREAEAQARAVADEFEEFLQLVASGEISR